ncbi:MAG: DUF5069 domain-containing protein, partial [Roseimicrobium sp.]
MTPATILTLHSHSLMIPDNLVPCSPSVELNGFAYFPRMVEKIRLHAQGRLRADLHDNLGKGMDGWCCDILQVAYDDLKAKTLSGSSDEELLRWCEETGGALNDSLKLVWNTSIHNFGRNDRASASSSAGKPKAGSVTA